MIRILGWELFEKADARKCPKMNWISVPVRHDGLGFRRVIQNPSHYAAWIVLLQVAAKCPRRGTLENGEGPLRPEDVGLMTGLDPNVMAEAIPVLEKVGWIEVIPEESRNDSGSQREKFPQPSGKIPATFRKPSGSLPEEFPESSEKFPPTLHNNTIHNKRKVAQDFDQKADEALCPESENPPLDLPEDGPNEKPIAIAKESGKEWPSGKIPIPFPALPPALAESPDVPELWDAWSEVRRKIRKPLTPRAASMAIRMLEGLAPGQAAETLRRAVVGGHQGLYPPQGGKGGGNGKFSRRCEVGGGFDHEGSDLFIAESARLAQEAKDEEEVDHEQ